MTIRSCVVTGGAGFIGSHLVKALVGKGTHVKIIDDLSSGSLENLDGVEGRLEFVEKKIGDLDYLRTFFVGADVVFHQAALTSVPESVENPSRCNEINVTGTLNILEAAVQSGVKRVVIASSSAVYGKLPEQPKSEGQTVAPVSPYAIAKYTGEMYARFYAAMKDLHTTCLRYFNVYGPYQNPNSQYAAVIPAFISRLLKGKSPTIFGDGKQSRDFVHVDDVVVANILAATGNHEAGQVFNVATGESVTLNELVRTLNRIMGSNLPTEHEPEREGDIKHSSADIQRIRKVLGFQPSVSLHDGLRSAVNWYRYRRDTT